MTNPTVLDKLTGLKVFLYNSELEGVETQLKNALFALNTLVDGKAAAVDELEKAIETLKTIKPLIEEIENEVHVLAVAAHEAETRIREQSPIIAPCINAAISSNTLTDPEKAALRNAWQWGIYSAAIHLQCGLGDSLRKRLTQEREADLKRFWKGNEREEQHGIQDTLATIDAQEKR